MVHEDRLWKYYRPERYTWGSGGDNDGAPTGLGGEKEVLSHEDTLDQQHNTVRWGEVAAGEDEVVETQSRVGPGEDGAEEEPRPLP